MKRKMKRKTTLFVIFEIKGKQNKGKKQNSLSLSFSFSLSPSLHLSPILT